MCGITALSRARKTSIPNGRDFMIHALRAIEDRGRHATGAGWSEAGDDTNVWYSTLEGRASLVAPRLGMPNSGIVNAIGHTRYATHGPSSDANNRHPVVHDGTILVHNGVLENDREILDMLDVRNPGLVDSFALAALVSTAQTKLGCEHPADALELVEGCAAVAWLSSNDPGELHLARLNTRPLAVAWTKRGDLVAASTPAALRALSVKADVKLRDFTELGEGEYLRVIDGEIVEFRTIAVRKPRYVRPEDVPTRNGARHLQQKLPVLDTDWWDDFDRTEPRTELRGYAHGVTDLFS